MKVYKWTGHKCEFTYSNANKKKRSSWYKYTDENKIKVNEGQLESNLNQDTEKYIL